MKQEKVRDRFPKFQERLAKIQGDRDQTEFADFLGVSRQTVGFYLRGERIPDIQVLADIANKCNVSADWLLGLSQTPAIDDKARSACDFLGISLDAARFLYRNKDNHPIAESINFLLENPKIITAISNYFAAFTLENWSSSQYRLIPLKSKPTENLSAVSFAKIIETLPTHKSMFEDQFRSQQLFIDSCLYSFVKRNLDLSECHKFVHWYEFDWAQEEQNLEEFYKSKEYSDAVEWLYEQIVEEESAEMAEIEETEKYRAICSLLHSLKGEEEKDYHN